MQGVGIITILNELRRHVLCTGTCAAEDDTVDARQVVDDALESKILVAGFYHIIKVSHIGRTLVACSCYKLHRIVHVVLGDVGNLTRHSGTEEQHLALVGHMLEYLVDIIDKTHVEHLVGLIKNYSSHVVEFYHSTPNQVLQSAGGGDYHLNTALDGLDLRFDARTAVDCQHLQPVDVAGIVFKVGLRLKAQLSRWVENKSLCGARFGVDALKHGQTEGRSLTGTRLSQSHHIGFFVKQVRYHHFLNGHGFLIPHHLDSAQEVVTHAKFFKSRHLESFFQL